VHKVNFLPPSNIDFAATWTPQPWAAARPKPLQLRSCCRASINQVQYFLKTIHSRCVSNSKNYRRFSRTPFILYYRGNMFRPIGPSHFLPIWWRLIWPKNVEVINCWVRLNLLRFMKSYMIVVTSTLSSLSFVVYSVFCKWSWYYNLHYSIKYDTGTIHRCSRRLFAHFFWSLKMTQINRV
jgi:hypothetical protein